MAVAATGFFDGVHIGHRKIIETLVDCARERNEQSLILTFHPHPRVVLQNEAFKLRLLSSSEEKLRKLQGMGVDRVEVLPFTKELAAVDTAGYLKLLSNLYDVSCIVLGYDNRIGSDQISAEETAELAQSFGMKAVVVPAEEYEGSAVSSTRIRNSLETGDVESASAMLGGNYPLDGVVVSGKQLGRTIGYPTANLRLSDPLKQVPGRGAYLTGVRIDGSEYYGMTNVGDIIETHIFDFNRDIYGLNVSLEFICRMRDEMKFSSVQELKNQLERDEMSAKNLIFGK